MIPATVVALLIFLLFVAPGICFELLRRRTRLPREESAFVEISRVILSGTLITAATLAILAVVHWMAPAAVIDVPQALINGRRYVSAHVTLTGWTLFFELLVAVLLAVIFSDIRTPERERLIHAKDAWHKVADTLADGQHIVGLSVGLSNGAEVMGYYVGASTDLDPEKRELILDGPMSWRSPDESEFQAMNDDWQFMVISGSEIGHLKAMRIGTETPMATRNGNLQSSIQWVANNSLKWPASACFLFLLLATVVTLGR